MTLLKSSAYLSLFIQIITGAIDIWGLTFQVPDDAKIFRDLLIIELVVQVIEFFFYVWMTFHIEEKKNITIYRYFDWFITTPSMLLTLMVYLDSSKDVTSVLQFIRKYLGIVVIVFVLNWIMLGIGLAGELGWIDEKKSALIGFIPFTLYYLIIYKTFIEGKIISKEQRNVFFYFVGIWSLYGIAALLPYQTKNAMYNILDLFAKNFFGLFLVYILYQKSKFQESI